MQCLRASGPAFADPAPIPIPVQSKASQYPGLPHHCAGLACAIKQYRIEMLAKHRAPTVGLILPLRYRHSELRSSGEQTNATYGWTGACLQRIAHTKLMQQRPGGRGNELAADFAARESALLNDCDAPPCARQQYCRCRTG